ncbi:hypothetical protein JKA74_20030 [Marivirga sp. S37H4]|uniref:Uncharacterized protein n=1 Tax=Marivirga aurantiaca TaxID=2802615 RepID=A0A935CC94_9BACT|nr:hypothetical protein [Marivirga aurantiaca]MBK6267342.1 hypothetical protein [Marivirga aurantiaca]
MMSYQIKKRGLFRASSPFGGTKGGSDPYNISTPTITSLVFIWNILDIYLSTNTNLPMHSDNDPLKKKNEKIRQENEIKKLKLSAEFGANFYNSENTNLPADVESQFLNYIQQFEEAAARKESKKIKEVLGNPVFKPRESLTDEELKDELSKVLEFMDLYHINLDVIYEVNEREIYRFVTEELMEEQLSIFGVPGMTSCFIYEEFYPNHEEDIKRYSVEFLDSLFNKNFEFMHYNIAQKMQINGENTCAELFVEKAKDLMEKAGEIILPSSEIKSIHFNNDKAEVQCEIEFEKLNQYTVNKKQKVTAHLFYYNDYNYWYINRIVLPELGFS